VSIPVSHPLPLFLSVFSDLPQAYVLGSSLCLVWRPSGGGTDSVWHNNSRIPKLKSDNHIADLKLSSVVLVIRVAVGFEYVSVFCHRTDPVGGWGVDTGKRQDPTIMAVLSLEEALVFSFDFLKGRSCLQLKCT